MSDDLITALSIARQFVPNGTEAAERVDTAMRAALEAQIATVAPAVDAQPAWRDACQFDVFSSRVCEHGTRSCIVDHASAQSEGLRKDAWRPIETAPSGAKGYCWMNLAWGPEGDVSTGIGMRWGDRFFAAGSFYCISQEKRYEFREIEVQPTHWMPLPEAPAALSQHTGEKDD